MVAAQALRAAGYGFTSVLLGRLLAARGSSPGQVGLLLAALVAGSAISSLVVGRFGDEVGRRRSYALIYLGVAVAGVIVASGAPLWLIAVVALSGTLSTDVVDNGPATTLEQAMLATEEGGRSGARAMGVYNFIGFAAGAVGALAQGAVGLVVHGSLGAVAFLVLVPLGLVGAALALSLSPRVEPATEGGSAELKLRTEVSRLGPSRRRVLGLAGLFAVDAGGGGLVTTTFLSYYLTTRYGAAPFGLGVLFFSITVLQAVSVLVAPRLADRFGLIPTMVGTHLPSNLLLVAAAFAPSLAWASVLLLARSLLSSMDVPTRQALVMAVVTPAERTPAAATTNAARYVVRPLGPLIAASLQQVALGAPLVVSGLVKAGYDVSLWVWGSRHKLDSTPAVDARGDPPDGA
ncbi:MAG: MFS transporter [Actinomycetes bacterium]